MTRASVLVALATGGLASAVLAFLSTEPVQLALISGFGMLTSVITWRSLGALAVYVRAKVEGAVTRFEAMGECVDRLEVGQQEMKEALQRAAKTAARIRSRVTDQEQRLQAHSGELRQVIRQVAELRAHVAATSTKS